MPNFLPVAAVIAICLFLLKETFELFRRMGERRRKRAAIKELLQYEVLENYRVLNSLFCAIDVTKRDTIAPDERNNVVIHRSGRMRYERVDAEGSIVCSYPLPSARMTEFNRLLPSAAELDKKLYAEIRCGYEHVYQLEHLHYSFMDFLTGADEDQELLGGFRQYASGCYDNIDKGLRHLYTLLASRELHYKGLRYSPYQTETSSRLNANDVKV